MLSSWRNLQHKIAYFDIFQKIKKNADFVRQITTPRMHPQNFWLCLSCSIFRWLCHGIQYFFLKGLFLRSNKGNKIACLQNFCPKSVLTQKVSLNKTRLQKQIKIWYFLDTDTFRASFVRKGKAIACLFFWKMSKNVCLGGELASPFPIPWLQTAPMSNWGIKISK